METKTTPLSNKADTTLSSACLTDRMEFSMCIEDVSPPTSLRIVDPVRSSATQKAATASMIDELESSVLAVQPVTPTRSMSDDDASDSSITSSNSSSSLAAISQSLKREHHKLVAEQQTKQDVLLSKQLDNESSFILTHCSNSKTVNKPINYGANNSQLTTNPAMLSKSPNFNSFYVYNENDTTDKQAAKSNTYDDANTPVSQTSARDTLLEMDSVKHKLSNLWNNVKYGWVNYIKKPSYKLDTDSDLPIYILGKKFYPSMNTSAYAQPEDYYFDPAILSATPNLSSSFSIVQTGSGEHRSDSLPIQLQNHQQQTNAMMNSFLSVSPPNTTIASISVPSSLSSSARPQFLNRLLSENLIRTPLEQEIYSRLWFTYRKDFEPLRGNTDNSSVKYTSDCGWGCMLRSAQMLIAQALLQHHFSKDWSLFRSVVSKQDQELYRDLISLFNDRPGASECPFGLHNLLEIADEDENKIAGINSKKSSTGNTGSRVGTWFGPTAVCFLVRDALNRYHTTTSRDSRNLLNNVRIYVAQDCTIFKKDVLKLCMSQSDENKSTGEDFVPCVILISVRLGGDSINPIYYDQLKRFFQMDICIGMIGGKPKHSLYFIGYQGDKVIYLDPHLCQPAVNVYSTKSESRKRQPSAGILIPNSSNKSNSLTRSPIPTATKRTERTGTLSYFLNNGLSSSSASSLSSINSNDCDLFDNSSFHCASPSKTSFAKLDPSLALGFYCRTLGDFQFLCDTVQQMDSTCSIFGVSESSFEQTQLDYELFNLEDKTPSNLDESSTRSKSKPMPTGYSKSSSQQHSSHQKLTTGGSPSSSPSSTTPVKSSNKNMKSFLVIPPSLATTSNTNNTGSVFQSSRFKSLTSLASNKSASTSKKPGKKGDSDDFVLV